LYVAVLTRITVTFFILLLFTRITGKKQLSQSTFFDFLTAIAIGDIAAQRLSDPEEPLLPWLAGTTLWFLLIVAVDLVVLKSRPLGKIVEGEPTVLIENGRILERNLARNYLRVDELMAQLREKGYFNPSQVEFAIFETDGNLSVQPRSQHRTLTPYDLNIQTDYEGVSRELIVDGRVIRPNLHAMGLSEAWLLSQLRQRGYQGPTDVFYASLDTQGQLYADGFGDPIRGSHIEVSDWKGFH
jgi:uncharacterized membrane protein YcaP (DUF421 family)